MFRSDGDIDAMGGEPVKSRLEVVWGAVLDLLDLRAFLAGMRDVENSDC